MTSSIDAPNRNENNPRILPSMTMKVVVQAMRSGVLGQPIEAGVM
jgi:hypothetical protein